MIIIVTQVIYFWARKGEKNKIILFKARFIEGAMDTESACYKLLHNRYTAVI